MRYMRYDICLCSPSTHTHCGSPDPHARNSNWAASTASYELDTIEAPDTP